MPTIRELLPPEALQRFPENTLRPRARRMLDFQIPPNASPEDVGFVRDQFLQRLPRLTIAATNPMLAAHAPVPEQSPMERDYARDSGVVRFGRQMAAGAAGALPSLTEGPSEVPGFTPFGTLPSAASVVRSVPAPRRAAERIARGIGGGAVLGIESAALTPVVGPVGAAAVSAGAMPGTPRERAIAAGASGIGAGVVGAVGGAVTRGATAQAAREAPAFARAAMESDQPAQVLRAGAATARRAIAQRTGAASTAAGAVVFGAGVPVLETIGRRLTGEKHAAWPTEQELLENVGLAAGVGAAAHAASFRKGPAPAAPAGRTTWPEATTPPAAETPGRGDLPPAPTGGGALPAPSARPEIAPESRRLVMGVAKGNGKAGDPRGPLESKQANPLDRGRTPRQGYLERVQALTAGGATPQEAARGARRQVKALWAIHEAMRPPDNIQASPALRQAAQQVQAKLEERLGGRRIQVQSQDGALTGEVFAVRVYPFPGVKHQARVILKLDDGQIVPVPFGTEQEMYAAIGPAAPQSGQVATGEPPTVRTAAQAQRVATEEPRTAPAPVEKPAEPPPAAGPEPRVERAARGPGETTGRAEPQTPAPAPVNAPREAGTRSGLIGHDTMQMSHDSIVASAKAQSDYEKSGEVEIFGVEGAKRYAALQSKANSTTASREATDAASAEIAKMEAALTPDQERRLFGIGETGLNAEELRHLERVSSDFHPDALAEESDAAFGQRFARVMTSSRVEADDLLAAKRLTDEAARRGWKHDDLLRAIESYAKGGAMSVGDARELLGAKLRKLQELTPRAPTAPEAKQIAAPAPESKPGSPEDLSERIIKSGRPFTVTTNTHATRYDKPGVVKLGGDGRLRLRSGKQWVHVTRDQLDHIARQVGLEVPDRFATDKVESVRAQSLHFHEPFQVRPTGETAHIQPERVQKFLRERDGYDAAGMASKPIQAWADEQGEIGPAGRMYVIDGHHRTYIAQRTWEKKEGGDFAEVSVSDRELPAVMVKGDYQAALAAAAEANGGGQGGPPVGVGGPEQEPPAAAAPTVTATPEPPTGARAYKVGTRLSVPYTGAASYFGKKVTRTREKGRFEGYVERKGQTMALVTVRRGKATEQHTFPVSAVRRLPKPATKRLPASKAKLESELAGDPEKARKFLDTVQRDLDATEASAKALYPQQGEQPTNEYRRARAKMRRLEDIITLVRRVTDAASVGAFSNERGGTPVFTDLAAAIAAKGARALETVSERIPALEDARFEAGEAGRKVKDGMLALWNRYVTSGGALLRTLGPSGRTLADGMDKGWKAWQDSAGQAVGEIEAVARALNDEQREAVGRALEEGGDGDAETGLAIAALRRRLKETIEDAKLVHLREQTKKGRVPIREREHYFPQQLKRSLRRRVVTPGTKEHERQIDYMQSKDPSVTREWAAQELDGYVRLPSDIRHGNLQHERRVQLAPEFREWDFTKVLPQYFLGATRRIEAARVFGPDERYGIAAALLREIPEARGARKSATLVLRGFLDPSVRELQGLAQVVNEALVVSFLTTAGIVQPAQAINTVAKYGYWKTMRGYAGIFNEHGRAWAESTGAAVQEQVQDMVGEGKGIGGHWVRIIGLEQFDRANRIAAAIAGRLAATEWAQQLAANPTNAKLARRFTQHGVDPAAVVAQKGILTPEQRRAFALDAANQTQFASRPTDLPPGRNTPQGKFIYLFRSFSIQQGRMVKQFVKDAAAGDPGPLLRYLAGMAIGGAAVGEIVSAIREWINGRKRRKSKLFWRWVEDMTYAGSIGIAADALRALASGPEYITGLLTGAAVSEAVKFTAEAGAAITSPLADDPMKAWHASSRKLLRHAIARTPLLGSRLADWLVPPGKKPSLNPLHPPIDAQSKREWNRWSVKGKDSKLPLAP